MGPASGTHRVLSIWAGQRTRYAASAAQATSTSRTQVIPTAPLTALAWCCLREAFRMFRLERIIALEVTGESFRPRRAALLRDYLGELRAREAGSIGNNRPIS